MLHDITKIAFLDELSKLSAFTPLLTQTAKEMVPQMLVGGTILGLGSLIHSGVKAIEDKYQDFKLSQEKIPMFKRMLELHPDLKENQPLAKLYFDALWHFSPTTAENPLSAGAYVKQALSMHHVGGGPMPASVEQLTAIEKNIQQALGSDRKEEGGMLSTMFMPFKVQAGGAYGFSAKGKKDKINKK